MLFDSQIVVLPVIPVQLFVRRTHNCTNCVCKCKMLFHFPSQCTHNAHNHWAFLWLRCCRPVRMPSAAVSLPFHHMQMHTFAKYPPVAAGAVVAPIRSHGAIAEQETTYFRMTFGGLGFSHWIPHVSFFERECSCPSNKVHTDLSRVRKRQREISHSTTDHHGCSPGFCFNSCWYELVAVTSISLESWCLSLIFLTILS